MEKYSFFEIAKYFCDDIRSLVDSEKFLKDIIKLENYISENIYCIMTHTEEGTNDQRSRYVNKIMKRNNNKNKTGSSVPCKQFLSNINAFLEETETDDINVYFDNMREKIAEKFQIDTITQPNQKIYKFVQEFLNLSPQSIFINTECSAFSKKLIEYLYKQNRFQEYIMWIIFISLYPIDVDRGDMNSLIIYWQINSKLKDAFNEINNGNSNSHSITPLNSLHPLSLGGITNFFLKSVIDDDQITAEKINEYIDSRKSVFDDELGIEADILQEDEYFRVALKDIQNILKEDNSYYICLKLLFFLPMYRIRTQELLKVPGINRSVIQNMRQKKVIFLNSGYAILDYSYQVVFDYMKNVSNDFTQLGKFEEFSFLSSDFRIGQWKPLLNILLIDERNILSDEEKKSLISSIHFGREESGIKKIYEQSILRRE